jgi:MoaA/NifB/PqqE/SkfB family radical SAM enzyme
MNLLVNQDFVLFYKNYIETSKTRSINVDVTYRCPLQCPFCQRQSGWKGETENNLIKQKINKSNDMPLSDLDKLIQYGDSINLCGQISDPIYHPNFIEVMDRVSKNPNKKFQIHTTATLKKVQWWEYMFSKSSNNVTWIFGLDGADQETANIYRVNTDFEEVLQVMKLGVSMGVNLQWQFIVFKHNEHQIEKVKNIAFDNNIPLRITISSRWNKKDMKKYNIYPPSDKWKSNTVTMSIVTFKP